MSTMTSPSSRSRCRPMSGSVRVRRRHRTATSAPHPKFAASLAPPARTSLRWRRSKDAWSAFAPPPCDARTGSTTYLADFARGTLVAQGLEEADDAVEQLHEEIPEGGPGVLGTLSESVRILHEPEAQEQDDEKGHALLQHAVHRLLLVSGEGCGRRNARTGTGRAGHHRTHDLRTPRARLRRRGRQAPDARLRRGNHSRAPTHGAGGARHHRLVDELADPRGRPA